MMSAQFNPPRQVNQTSVHLVGGAAQGGVADSDSNGHHQSSACANAANEAHESADQAPQAAQPPDAAKEAASTGVKVGVKAGSKNTKLPPVAQLSQFTQDFCIAAASEDEGGRWWKYEGMRKGDSNPKKMKEKVAQSLLAVWDNEELNSTIRPYHISRSLNPKHLDAHLLEVLAYTKKDLRDDTDGTGSGTQTEQEAQAKLRPRTCGRTQVKTMTLVLTLVLGTTSASSLVPVSPAAFALASLHFPLCMQWYQP
jgi:hypothetical protein